MMGRGGGRPADWLGWAVGILSCCVAGSGWAIADEAGTAAARVVWIDRGDVRVVGGDVESVQAVAALAADLAVAAGEWTPWREQRLEGRPEVHLVAAERWTHPWPVVLVPGVRWPVAVHLSWGAETRRSTAREAVLAAWLGQVYTERGLDHRPPPWLLRGLAHALEVRQNPAVRDAAVRWAVRSNWPQLGDLLQGRVQEAEPSWWLWQGLRDHAGAPSAWRERLTRMMAHENPWAGLAVLLDGELSDGTSLEFRGRARQWWEERGTRAAAEREGAYLSLATSRSLVEALAHITIVEHVDGTGEIPAAEWYVAAADAGVRARLEHQEEAIRRDLARVHPVWHNALLSLGRLAEAARQGEVANAVAAHRAWQADLASAVELSALLDELVGPDGA